MNINVGQIYTEVGAAYPFTYHFQNWISKELTERVQPSNKFTRTYGFDFDLTLNVSAKSSIKTPEIKGPTVFKRTKDIEFTLFLPHDGHQPRTSVECRRVIKLLLDSIVVVLKGLQLDPSGVVKDASLLIEHIINNPEMIKIEDEALGDRLVESPLQKLQKGLPHEHVQMMFASAARAKWNIEDVCSWSYFFTSYDRDRLVSAASALAEMGYRAAEIADTPEDERKPLLYLRVEREERHTMQSLEARNQELARFAQEFGLESYDGMEAGPIGS